MIMNNLKVLILTDHSNHTSENSLYALSKVLFGHDQVSTVHIASRNYYGNHSFFLGYKKKFLWVNEIDNTFEYSELNHPLETNLIQIEVDDYDFIWLRLPPPLSEDFLIYLSDVFDEKIIINDPLSIYETGSKAFLFNFQQFCPPMRLCRCVEEIREFSNNHPIVLKPLREYGGKGIIKIGGDWIYDGRDKSSLESFLIHYDKQPLEYLAVKYLDNVHQGDKRIIVIDGQVMGASLRLPAENSWICNVAMGGTSHHTDISKEELDIVEAINPLLNAKGIIMYGLDTLVGDDGKRVLSEINTTSIGGLPQIARLTKKPLVKNGMDLMVNYVLKRI